MNFLAHIYLSGTNEQVRIGNFIGDHVKGRSYQNYPEKIKEGILLHREIDSYTDNHHLVKETMNFFRPSYRRYSGIIVDMIFDHLLAANWNEFHPDQLNKFAKTFYRSLVKNYRILPRPVKYFTPFIIQNNRLYSYKDIKGIQEAIQIMANHTSLPDYTDQAIATLEKNYSEIKDLFILFMNDIDRHVNNVHFGA